MGIKNIPSVLAKGANDNRMAAIKNFLSRLNQLIATINKPNSTSTCPEITKDVYIGVKNMKTGISSLLE